MAELDDLYQELILDHARHPRNFRVLEDADRTAEGYNPLCGDRVRVFVRLREGRIEEITFQGAGCAISTASASLMSEALNGVSAEQADALYRDFHALLTAEPAPPGPAGGLGKLAALSGVRRFPMRVKCATLAWHTLRAAMEQRREPISTE
jgi:nitrogen fixation NifU-like protein